jgi:hypothetical protein
MYISILIMTILFSIPEVLTSSLISEWSNTKDLVRLDSAVCSKLYRSSLLCHFASNITVGDIEPDGDVDISDHNYLNEHGVMWVLNRKIKLRNVVISRYSFDQKSGPTLFDLDCTQIETVMIITPFPSGWNSARILINGCSKMVKILSFINSPRMYPILLGIERKILNQLQKIPLINGMDELKCVAQHCYKLVDFGFTGWETDDVTQILMEGLVLKTVQNNVNTLKKLKLANHKISDSFYAQVNQLCPNLLLFCFIQLNPAMPTLTNLIKTMSSKADKLMFNSLEMNQLAVGRSYFIEKGGDEFITAKFQVSSDITNEQFVKLCSDSSPQNNIISTPTSLVIATTFLVIVKFKNLTAKHVIKIIKNNVHLNKLVLIHCEKMKMCTQITNHIKKSGRDIYFIFENRKDVCERMEAQIGSDC